MGWFERSVRCAGSVFFRGPIPPRAENFLGALADKRVHVLKQHPSDDIVHWKLELEHPEWGTATALCLRNSLPPPPEVVNHAANLTDRERALAKLAGSSVSVMHEGKRSHVLRDRKTLLRFLSLFAGDDGVLVADHLAQALWTRAALDDELAHDADLDVQALFAAHVVRDNAESPAWLHTHGLAEIGFFDFDVLDPADDYLGRGFDTLRAMAFAIVEGSVQVDTRSYAVTLPKGKVRLVPIEAFLARASTADKAIRSGADESHNRQRAVLCEPGGGFWRFWGDRVRPSALLRQPPPEEMMVSFSTEASELMAARARATFAQFRRFRDELADLECSALVKLGFQVDGGGPTDREHLWFEVHGANESTVDATLANQPFYVSRLKSGERGTHSVELLSDWAIFTPAGSVTPRDVSAVRTVREKGDELRSLLRESKRGG